MAVPAVQIIESRPTHPGWYGRGERWSYGEDQRNSPGLCLGNRPQEEVEHYDRR